MWARPWWQHAWPGPRHPGAGRTARGGRPGPDKSRTNPWKLIYSHSAVGVTFHCKGTVAWDVFFSHNILSRRERKDQKFFSCSSNIYWVRAFFNSISA
jgi:hypothetical protein